MNTDARAKAEEHWRFLSPIIKTIPNNLRVDELIQYIYIEAFMHGWKHAEGSNGIQSGEKAESIAGELLYLYGTIGNLKNAYMDSKAMRSLYKQGRLTEEEMAKYIERLYDNLSEFYHNFKYAMKGIESIRRTEDEEVSDEQMD